MARCAVIDMPVSGQRGDGHRRFALAIDLREAGIADHRKGAFQVRRVHGRAAIDDRATRLRQYPTQRFRIAVV